MDRATLSDAELRDWIKTQLKLEDGCGGAEFYGTFRKYPVQSPEDCNWEPNTVTDLDDYSVKCRGRLQKVIVIARSRFNLK